MAQFRFLKNGRGVLLDQVEEEYLTALGPKGDRAVIPCIGTRSALFEVLCISGIACTFHGPFDRKSLDEIYAMQDPIVQSVSLDFLNGRYKFESWR